MLGPFINTATDNPGREALIKMMLAAKVYLGSTNLSFGMKPYVFTSRKEIAHKLSTSP
ncbi:hypothetical protein TVAG_417480 [Trichomonas vaginalis G3]|uniref:Uncharacterized protein n=1 Tax=Trichomonas vaginalis (strain ATCC PRA-98 / G3) TaxID=412133 RepID=A2F5Z9_TRIV3|nr:structural constituent of ribosome [Trichomonas vaginalis G3]EAX99680.1 hypothetical protein TVAG_417480 [Trichomonas vaginalis G3]KAI5494329.1 structural constituent of ribosome [Trichomonas vaginalis G3]|eukprot:XP_001312610.1 hypothetical protein [Trichomonas vaginalis G3]